MKAGCEIKTTNRVIRAFWPSEHERRDFQFGCDIGKWIGHNERTLNKTPLDRCCKLLTEEFPYLTEVEVRDFSGRIAKI